MARIATLPWLLAAAALTLSTSTAHAAWVAPETVRTAPGPDASATDGAAVPLPDHTVLAVWDEYDGDDAQRIRWALRAPGGGWSAPSELSAGVEDFAPVAAANERGDVAVAWTSRDGEGNDRIVLRRRPAQDGWQPAQELELPAAQAGWSPGRAQVALDAAGRLTVALTVMRHEGFSLRETAVVVRRDGEPTRTLDTADSTLHEYLLHDPQVAAGGDGGAVVSWLRMGNSSQGGTSAIRVARPTVTSWTTRTLESPATTPTEPGATAAAGPGALITWIRDGAVRAARWQDGGEPTVQTIAPAGPDAAHDLAAAVDPAGRFTLAWQEAPGTLRVARGTLGEPVGAPGTVATAGTAGEVRVTHAGEHRLLAWLDDGGREVRATAAGSAQAPFAEPAVLATLPAGEDAGHSHLALRPAGSGDAAAVWSTWTASGSHALSVGGFDGAAPELLDVQAPAEGAAGAPLAFAARAVDTWSGPQLRWTFGDGDASAGEQVRHAYAAAGSFTAAVEAVDAAGRRTAATAGTVQVTEPPAPPPAEQPRPPAAPVAPPAAKVLVAAAPRPRVPSRLTLDRRGRLAVRLTVAGPARGTLRVRLTARGRRPVTLGSTRFTADRAGTITVRVRASKAARRMLRAKPRGLRAVATVR